MPNNCQTCVTLTSNVPNSLQIDQAGNVTALAPQNLNYTLSDTCGCCTGVAINGSTAMPVAVTVGQKVVVTILGCSGRTIASVTCQGSSSSSSKSQSSASSQSSVSTSNVSTSGQSGSAGSNSSSSFYSVIVPCCNGVSLPNTLYATFTGSFAAFGTLRLDYVSGSGYWESPSVTACGITTTWQFGWSIGLCNVYITTSSYIAAYSKTVITVVSCSPLYVTETGNFLFFSPGSISACAGSFGITITQ